MTPPGQGCPEFLAGPPFDRGRQQAERFPEAVAAVRAAIRLRLDPVRDVLAEPASRDFLAEQRRFTADCYPAALEELRGLAAGFGVAEDDLFAYQHLAVLVDMAAGPQGTVSEGCTAWAAAHPDGGALLAKNRDYHGEHRALQRVFHQADPAWRGREVLSIASLGTPAAISSGINSAGLAVADTAVATTDHGVGLLRYFLMGRLLAECDTVAEALASIDAVTHAGGGTLLLADAPGTVAVVELGHRVVAREERASAPVARTNHFACRDLAPSNRTAGAADAGGRNSRARLEILRASLAAAARPWDLDGAATVLAGHGEAGGTALCRHIEDGDSLTISTALYFTSEPSLRFSDGPPCGGRWAQYRFGDGRG
jgi:hypothetical protein